MNAKNGTEQLTKTLNGYIQALVSEIMDNDGDILKFAGKDAPTVIISFMCVVSLW